MADIFRKKSLDRLSSPEQLDKMIVINTPMTWLALLGGAAIIMVVVIWGILGRVPITESATGILLSDSVLTSVYAQTEGVVTKTYVSSGDYVEEGDVLYEVNSTSTALAIEQLEARIETVESITFDSEDDEVTSDTQALIEIKSQKSSLSLDTEASQLTLEILMEEYEEAKAEVSRLETAMNAAAEAYYAALEADNGTVLEYEYSLAASEYEAAETTYQTLLAAVEVQPEDEDLLAQLEEAKAERDSKEAVYQQKKSAYESYLNNYSSISSDITEKANEYSNALSEYSTAKSLEQSLYSEIRTVEVQLSQSEASEQVLEEQLEEQFESTKAATLDQLNQELENYELLQTGQEITAPSSGTVYSTFVTNGSVVALDSEVARISQDDGDDSETLQAVYYMPLSTGKSVKVGMTMNVYAANLAKEEYGHMTGTVISVAEYVTSYADLVTRLGDETLATEFTSEGSVIEIVCELEVDEDTVSGFAWSTNKGEEVELEVGTMLEGSVIVEEVPPITMLIPKLKEMFNME